MKLTATAKQQREVAAFTETGAFEIACLFSPHDKVWTMYDNRPEEMEIIHVKTLTKVDASTSYRRGTSIVYVLKNGAERAQQDVFASLNELIESFRL